MAASWPSRMESNGPSPRGTSSGSTAEFSWGFCVSTAFSFTFSWGRAKLPFLFGQILKLRTFQRPAGLQHGVNHTLVLHAHWAQDRYFRGQSAGHADGHTD